MRSSRIFRTRRANSWTTRRSKRLLALKPEVVLLGTGERIVFPPQKMMAAFLKRGIGLETMDSAAAARTFNVLVERRPQGGRGVFC